VVKVRRVLLWLIIAFAIYAVFNDPNHSAQVVGNAWDTLKQGISRVFDFFNALMNT
jgi:hypothetical protein